jgi:hypothetical protein
LFKAGAEQVHARRSPFPHEHSAFGRYADQSKRPHARFNEGATLQLAYLQEGLLVLSKADIGADFEKVPSSSRLRVKGITLLPPEVRACISDVTIAKEGSSTSSCTTRSGYWKRWLVLQCHKFHL